MMPHYSSLNFRPDQTEIPDDDETEKDVAAIETNRSSSWFKSWKDRNCKVQRIQSRQAGWRPTMLTWTYLVAAVFVLNLSIFVWSCVRKPPALPPTAAGYSGGNESGNIVFMGDCDTVSTIKTWTHLAINILSSLLLIASANTMQCLGSPTRKEIDRAHSRGHWIDISMLSTRNFRFIQKRRVFLWTILALSSMPLHLFYNSVIFTSIGARNVSTFLASREFTSDVIFNSTWIERSFARSGEELSSAAASKMTPFVMAMMPRNANYNSTTLSVDDCFDHFSNRVVSTYKAVTLVLNVTDQGQLLYYASIIGNGMQQPWTCNKDPKAAYISTGELFSSCGACASLETDLCGKDLTTGFHNYTQSMVSESTDTVWFMNYEGGYQLISCEALPAIGYCGIQVAPSLFVYVLIANACKLLTMLYTVLYLKFEPLVTVGDAVRTFVESPDPQTVQLGPVSAQQVQSARKDRGARVQNEERRCDCKTKPIEPWRQVKRRWASCVSGRRWVSVLSLCIALEVSAGALMYMALVPSPQYSAGDRFTKSKTAGLGAVDPAFFTPLPVSDVASLSLVSNAPQILVSIVYVAYYSLLSIMLVSAETAAFAKERKSLRVSPPQYGSQRGTYWLTIPMRFSLPLLVAMTGLHYLISQSIFIVRLNQVDSGSMSPDGSDVILWDIMNGLGYSPIAIVAAMSLGAAIILFPVVLGLSCHLPQGIPSFGHNSIALSAACHPDPADPADLAEKPLMYGVLQTRGVSDRRRVGFSSSSVEPLRDGEVYERTACLRSMLNPTDTFTCCTEQRNTGVLPPSDRQAPSKVDEVRQSYDTQRTKETAWRMSLDSDEDISADLGDGLRYTNGDEARSSFHIEEQTLLERANSRRTLNLENW